LATKRLTPVSSINMGSTFTHSYLPGSIVQSGDEDLGNLLTDFGVTIKHTGNSGGYRYTSWVENSIYDD